MTFVQIAEYITSNKCNLHYKKLYYLLKWFNVSSRDAQVLDHDVEGRKRSLLLEKQVVQKKPMSV